MGRPEAPLPGDVSPPLRELVERLRQLREESNLSYRDMGVVSEVSAASLSRAASGRTVPSRDILAAYLNACGVPEAQFDDWDALRQDALRQQLGEPLPWTPEAVMAHLITSGRLRELYEAANSPTVRMIGQQSGIPRSTIQRFLRTIRTDGHDQVLPPRQLTRRVAEALLQFLRPRQRAHFSDVDDAIRRNSSADLVRRPHAEAARPKPRQSADAALLRLARRADDLEHYLAASVMQADDEFVRLLGLLQDSVREAREVLRTEGSSTEATT